MSKQSEQSPMSAGGSASRVRVFVDVRQISQQRCVRRTARSKRQRRQHSQSRSGRAASESDRPCSRASLPTHSTLGTHTNLQLPRLNLEPYFCCASRWGSTRAACSARCALAVRPPSVVPCCPLFVPFLPRRCTRSSRPSVALSTVVCQSPAQCSLGPARFESNRAITLRCDAHTAAADDAATKTKRQRAAGPSVGAF